MWKLLKHVILISTLFLIFTEVSVASPKVNSLEITTIRAETSESKGFFEKLIGIVVKIVTNIRDLFNFMSSKDSKKDNELDTKIYKEHKEENIELIQLVENLTEDYLIIYNRYSYRMNEPQYIPEIEYKEYIKHTNKFLSIIEEELTVYKTYSKEYKLLINLKDLIKSNTSELESLVYESIEKK